MMFLKDSYNIPVALLKELVEAANSPCSTASEACQFYGKYDDDGNELCGLYHAGSGDDDKAHSELMNRLEAEINRQDIGNFNVEAPKPLKRRAS